MIYDTLAVKYHYDGGWAFEDGACPAGHPNNADEWCNCPRPWSDAWMALCDALGDWDSDRVTLKMMAEYMKDLFGD